jgi:hypothetical protein
MYHVSRMSDQFGRLAPPGICDPYWASAALTWGALGLETLLPLVLWYRPIRSWAILAGMALHMGIELSMHLFLFEWLMMLGLLSFLDLPKTTCHPGSELVK